MGTTGASKSFNADGQSSFVLSAPEMSFTDTLSLPLYGRRDPHLPPLRLHPRRHDSDLPKAYALCAFSAGIRKNTRTFLRTFGTLKSVKSVKSVKKYRKLKSPGDFSMLGPFA